MYRFGIEIGKLARTAPTPSPKHTQTYPGGFPACIGFTITTVYVTLRLPEGLPSTMTKTTVAAVANIIASAATTKKTMNVSFGLLLLFSFNRLSIVYYLYYIYGHNG